MYILRKHAKGIRFVTGWVYQCNKVSSYVLYFYSKPGLKMSAAAQGWLDGHKPMVDEEHKLWGTYFFTCECRFVWFGPKSLRTVTQLDKKQFRAHVVVPVDGPLVDELKTLGIPVDVFNTAVLRKSIST